MRKHIPVLVALLAVGACADNRSSVEISGRAAPSDDTKCTFDAASGKTLLGSGALDLSLLRSYRLIAYVHNNLANPQDTTPEALPSAKAWRATAAKVRVNPKEYVDRFGASPALLAFSGENTIPLDGQTIEPGGVTAQEIDALSSPVGTAIAAALTAGGGGIQRVVLGITLEGITLDDKNLDTSEWYYPIDVCSGCLAATCPADTTPASSVACVPLGQDGAVVCLAP